MTTIAYRDGILAVDRMLAHGHFVRPTDMKLFLVKSSFSIEYGFACTGTITMGLAFVEWVEGGMVKGQFPIPITDSDKKSYGFHALLVTRAPEPQCVYYGYDLLGMPEHEVPYTAQGSGDEFALGAMFHGATAIEAVQTANHMCAWSGYGVNYVDLAGDYVIKRTKIARVE